MPAQQLPHPPPPHPDEPQLDEDDPQLDDEPQLEWLEELEPESTAIRPATTAAAES